MKLSLLSMTIVAALADAQRNPFSDVDGGPAIRQLRSSKNAKSKTKKGKASRPTVAPSAAAWNPTVVTAEFGFSKIEACETDDVKVVWLGYHNLQETKSSDCNSDDIGNQISDYQGHEDAAEGAARHPGYERTFFNNEMSAAPGETRYFKCDIHCWPTAARIEVSCPENTTVITAEFGFSQIEACETDDVRVVWLGYHNLQETTSSDCNSDDIGNQISDYQNAGYERNFNNEMSAAPGETRYFKCSSHCSPNASRIEVSCPE